MHAENLFLKNQHSEMRSANVDVSCQPMIITNAIRWGPRSTAGCRIPKDRWESWLDPSNQDADDLRKLMEYSDLYDGLRVYAISNSVNSVSNNGPELIKPISLGEPQTLF